MVVIEQAEETRPHAFGARTFLLCLPYQLSKLKKNLINYRRAIAPMRSTYCLFLLLYL